MMRYLVVILFMLVLSACDPDHVINDIESFFKNALENGDLIHVTVSEDGTSTISVNGVYVGTSKQAITTGCFGIPECVALDEEFKAIIKLADDEFVMFDVAGVHTGTTYFLDTFYSPYWYSNANPTAFRNIVDNYGSGMYAAKLLLCCANLPDICHCEE